MSQFLFPVTGLLTNTDLDLPIGKVRLLGPEQAQSQLDHAVDAAALPGGFANRLREFESEVGTCVSALVEADDADVAVELVETALDVLRVFLHTRVSGKLPSFGITDGVLGGATQYADLVGPGLGWIHIGHFTGVHITQETVEAFVESDFAQVAGTALGEPEPGSGQAKALLAIRLASRAMVTHDPATRTILIMTAAEVLLFGPGERSKLYRLAQRSAFLLCGQPEGEPCGRGRPSCLILNASLERGKEGAKRLEKVERMGNADVRWRCSEWHDVLDWYRIRSAVLHEGSAVDEGDASRVSWWLSTRLLPAALDWYREHPENPHRALESALHNLPRPPAWQLDYERAYQELAHAGAFGEVLSEDD